MQRTAVVTGGASGIGRCAVERLLQDGWIVWALDNSPTVLDETAGPARDRSRYRAWQCDVGSPASVAAAFAAIAGETDSIDALICCAGVTLIGALENITAEEAARAIDVNFKGPWLTIRQALPQLRKNATVAEPSRVVIVGSISGIRPKVGSGFYAATKSAAHVLASIFAVELAPSGILVNVVAPGSVDTPMMRGAIEAGARAAPGTRYKPSGESPLGRIAQPDDIVDVIRFLLTDAARYVNGVVLPVDGGTRAAFVKS